MLPPRATDEPDVHISQSGPERKWALLSYMRQPPDPAFNIKTGNQNIDALLALAARIQATCSIFVKGTVVLILAAIYPAFLSGHAWIATFLIGFAVVLMFILCVTNIAIFTCEFFHFGFQKETSPLSRKADIEAEPRLKTDLESAKNESITVEWDYQGATEKNYHQFQENIPLKELIGDVAACLDGRAVKSGYGRNWWLQLNESQQVLDSSSSGRTLKELKIKPGMSLKVLFGQVEAAS